jgi:hypothetical protein
VASHAIFNFPHGPGRFWVKTDIQPLPKLIYRFAIKHRAVWPSQAKLVYQTVVEVGPRTQEEIADEVCDVFCRK